MMMGPGAGGMGGGGDLYGQLELHMGREDWAKVEEIASNAGDPALVMSMCGPPFK